MTKSRLTKVERAFVAAALTLAFALALVALGVVFLPGLIADELPHQPPFPGERCEDVYETHVELSGDSWCDMMPCNGARCWHVGRTLHFHGWQPRWESWAICSCVK